MGLVFGSELVFKIMTNIIKIKNLFLKVKICKLKKKKKKVEYTLWKLIILHEFS